jgi:hypothetical protein
MESAEARTVSDAVNQSGMGATRIWMMVAIIILFGLATGSIRIEVTTRNSEVATDQ